MAKIYVSATYLDLQDHRAQVEKVIRRMGHTDVAMEYYVAEDTRPVKKCLDDVAACDIYVGIYAWRYGWQPIDDNPDKLSITEMELRQAEKTGKPCLIFLLSDDAPWPRKHMDKDISKTENLRNTASAHHTADYFTTPDELARKVAEAIYKQIPAAVSIPEHNLGTYFDALRKRYNVLALEGLTPPQKEEYLQIQLRSVYVEQSVREDAPPVELPKEVWEKLSREKEIHDEDLPSGITMDDVRKTRESYYQKPSRLVLDALTDSRNQYTIILGNPGSGKSTLARYAMLSLIDPALADEKIQRAFDGYLPLLIELRTFAGLCAEGKCQTPLEFLEYLGKTEGWGLTQSALHNHLKNDGRAVVIFDGLDEIFEPKLRETITNQIVGFTNAYPKARVIVTSRILGYRRKILSDAGFTHFTLQDLNEEQVRAFITKWYDLAMSDRPDEAKERSGRILKSFADSASIRQLAGNPMLLTIMAIIGKHQELPRERWKLYDHAASVLIQHWDVNKHLKDERIEADFIGEDDKKELLRRLAFRMQSGDGGLAGNYMHREALQEEFENYLKERYSQTPAQAKVIADAMIQQFRERNFILSLYGANVFGFVHRAFLEYFCASAFVWKFEKTKELTIEQLKTDVYGKHWEDQSWHEVLRLICGIIDEKWAKQIIDYLINMIGDPFPSNLDRLPWNLFVAINCLREINNLNAFTSLIEQIVQMTCALLDQRMKGRSTLYDFLSKKIFPSITGISSELHSNHIIVNWLKKRPSNENIFLMYGQLFSNFVSIVGHDSDEVHQELLNYASSNEANKRLVAVVTLSDVWCNASSSFQIAKDFALNDSNLVVRLTSVECLADCFQENAETLDLLWNIAKKEEDSDIKAQAIDALARSYRTNNSVLDFLLSLQQSPDHELRRKALEMLGLYYSELPQVRKVLWNLLENKDDPEGQAMVIFPIAASYKNEPETFSLLSRLLTEDSNPAVRVATAWALGVEFRDDTRALNLLNHLVTHDHDKDVRSVILDVLYNRVDLGVIHNIAMQDSSGEVRSRAISTLADRFLEEPQAQIKEFLYKLAVQESSPKAEDPNDEYYPREAAIEAIAEHWRDHPDTLGLLRERAEHDPTPWLRERCKELIKEIEGKK